MRRPIVLGMLVAAGAVTTSLAVQRGGEQPVQIEKVKDNLYMISGSGGNTAVFVRSNGVVLVDTKYAGDGHRILEKVKSVTDRPITHIINTHTHADHVGSNDFFPAAVEIVTHENTASNMMKMEAFQDPAKKHGLPDRTFKDKMTVLSGNDAIDLYYFGNAHTSGDAFVVFRALRVMHAGDVFPRPGLPLIDMNNGGSGVAYPGTLRSVARGITNVETVIPGHSALTNWQAFLDYGEFVGSFVDSVSAAAKAGKTAEQALSEFKPAPKFADYDFTRGKADVDVIYKEVKK